MHLGIGLPVDDPDVLLDWARRADAGPFRTLGLLDRLVWHNPEPMVTLAVLAGATTRVRLQTEVLLAPLRATALLGAQVATLDRLSGGRFTLGVGLGGRPDDFAAAGVAQRGPGARLDAQMAQLREQWAGTPRIGPVPSRPGGPEVLFGAFREPALARIARFGDGLLCAAPPAWAGGLFATVDRYWDEAGRAGRPRFVGQLNVALGGGSVVGAAHASMAAYYAFTGAPDRMTAGLLTSRATVDAADPGLRRPGRRRGRLLLLGDRSRPGGPPRRPRRMTRTSAEEPGRQRRLAGGSGIGLDEVRPRASHACRIAVSTPCRRHSASSPATLPPQTQTTSWRSRCSPTSSMFGIGRRDRWLADHPCRQALS